MRGLKLPVRNTRISEGLSHASRVRGLKLSPCNIHSSDEKSHASRVRGLKRKRGRIDYQSGFVARFTRAWIETRKTDLEIIAASRTLHACVD